MAEAGMKPKAGQEARLLSITVTGFKHGAFETIHGEKNGADFANRLKSATSSHYGHAGPLFVERLLADESDLPAYFDATRKLPVFQSAEGAERRAADTFALIGMAGELATSYGLTGWDAGEAIKASVLMFNLWRDTNRTGYTEGRQILEMIQDFIGKHGDSRFSSLDNGGDAAKVINRAGWWRDKPEGRMFVFLPAALKEAATGFNIDQIIAALNTAGWIYERGKDKTAKLYKPGGVAVPGYAILPKLDADHDGGADE